MLERERAMGIPTQQRMERQASVAKEHMEEHKAALQRAVALDVPQAYSPSPYGTFNEDEEAEKYRNSQDSSFTTFKVKRERWDDLARRLFSKD